jgi:acyl-CoA hydrolase
MPANALLSPTCDPLSLMAHEGSCSTKTPAESRVEMTQLVLPSDTNALGTTFGGKMMQWVDMAGGVAGRRHAGCVAVTAAIDSLQFSRPVHLGDVVVLYACVNRTWHSSMEVGVRVECESAADSTRYHAVRAYLTFVAVDEAGQPRPVPAIRPTNSEEERRFAQAEARRNERLRRRKEWLG